MWWKSDRSHLPADLERARELLQLDVGDAGNLARLLDIGAVRADGQSHQVLAYVELIRVPARAKCCTTSTPTGLTT